VLAAGSQSATLLQTLYISPLRNANGTFMYRRKCHRRRACVQLAPALSNISSRAEKMHLSVCISHLFRGDGGGADIALVKCNARASGC